MIDPKKDVKLGTDWFPVGVDPDDVGPLCSVLEYFKRDPGMNPEIFRSCDGKVVQEVIEMWTWLDEPPFVIIVVDVGHTGYAVAAIDYSSCADCSGYYENVHASFDDAVAELKGRAGQVLLDMNH